MRIVRIELRRGLHDALVHVLQVRELGLVEKPEDAGLDLLAEEAAGGHDDVIAGMAGEKLGLQRLVGIVDVVIDLDAGLLLEGLDRVLADIVRPVVDVEDLLLIGPGRTGEADRGRRGKAEHGISEFHHRGRPCDCLMCA